MNSSARREDGSVETHEHGDASLSKSSRQPLLDRLPHLIRLVPSAEVYQQDSLILKNIRRRRQLVHVRVPVLPRPTRVHGVVHEGALADQQSGAQRVSGHRVVRSRPLPGRVAGERNLRRLDRVRHRRPRVPQRLDLSAAQPRVLLSQLAFRAVHHVPLARHRVRRRERSDAVKLGQDVRLAGRDWHGDVRELGPVQRPQRRDVRLERVRALRGE
mmetsp:Transcript_3336/g.13556  ORF Transcript_3336/g.13556 Transcript_3336/m.13556 type:complete len:215 (-) Transcript_3336:436-1080(-)